LSEKEPRRRDQQRRPTAVRGGGLGSGPVELAAARRRDAAGTSPTCPVIGIIGATDFSDDPAIVDTADTDSFDCAGTGQEQ